MNPEGRVLFTREMKKTYKILFPGMCEIHFRILQNVLQNAGYDIELLTDCGRQVIDEGLKYVHNDACYPALLTIGQMIYALKSGRYDVHRVALMMSQTGGGCRASNYIFLLRKALKAAGLEFVPVISVNFNGMEKNPGFRLTLPLIRRGMAALVYGDLLMTLRNRVRPYEQIPGETEKLVSHWVDTLCALLRQGKGLSVKAMRPILSDIARTFSDIPVLPTPKIRVGIVGEIYAKYCPLANNNLEDFLTRQNCEIVVPPLMGFFLYMMDTRKEDHRLYGGHTLSFLAACALYKLFARLEGCLLHALDGTRFAPITPFSRIRELAKPFIGLGCKMGEGWFLTGEILELIETGTKNIVCAQPFGCLPNHIVAKGMVRPIREKFPDANIVSVDYDASATQVNQENRIRLMLSVARDNLNTRTAS